MAKVRVLTLVVLVSTALSSADGAVLCSTRSGRVMLREACRSTEAPIDPIALGLQGAPGPQGPAGPQGATGAQGPPGPGLVVKDANGALVGPVLEQSGGGLIVTRTINGHSLGIEVRKTGFMPNFSRLFFESNDCSGQALLFISVNDELNPLFFVASVDGATAYYPSTMNAADGRYTFTRSLLEESGSGLQCRADVYGSVAVPAIAFDLTTLGLVPPFHVEGP